MPLNANIRTVLRLVPLGLLALALQGSLAPEEGGAPKEEGVVSGHLESGTTVTFTSSGDAWVNEAFPSTNYGSASRLEVGQNPGERAYLKFNVTGLTGTITSAKLKLHSSTSGSLDGGEVYRSANTTWAENTITWANQPGIIGNELATVTPVPGNSWHTWDVTAAVAGNGTYSFVVAAQTSDGFILYSEEETTNTAFRPVLEITTVPATTFGSSGDAWVNEGSPGTNYGTNSRLEVGLSPGERAYVKFNVSNLNGPVVSAKLKLHTSTSGSVTGGQVYRAANTTWSETGITWSNQPGTIGSALAAVELAPGDTWLSWDVTSAVTGNGTYAFVVTAATNDGFILYSEEEATQTSYRPVLEIVTSPVVTFTSSGDAWVNEGSPNTNYGSNSRLEVGQNPGERAYIRFNVTNLTGPVTSARLKLHTSTSGSLTGAEVYRAANTTWGESTITWSNQPGTTGSVLSTVSPVPGNAWHEWDVTSAVTGNGTYAFVVTATSSDGFILYSEEEATYTSFRPVLELNGSAGGGGGGGGGDDPANDVVDGWASMGTGTTGGGNATPCVATSKADFKTKLASTPNSANYCAVIELAANVQGDHTGNGERFYIPSNKTLYGQPGVTLTGSLVMDGVSNIIVRDLTIVGYNCAEAACGDGTDAVQIVNGSHHIWLHHLAISDGTDGNLDISKESDFITASWCKFFYTSSTRAHRFSSLIGHKDGYDRDIGKLNVTFHHNWWAQNIHDRMPMGRYGKIHVYNNLYTSAGNNNCVRVQDHSNFRVQSNVFNDVNDPLYRPNGGTGILGGGQNIFNDNVTGQKDETSPTGTVFSPPYSYTIQAASTVQAAVQAGAGPR